MKRLHCGNLGCHSGSSRRLRVSVVVDSFNYAQYLEAAVSSAALQSYPPDEIIVVDDGSTDDTPEVAAKLATEFDHVAVISKENGGQLSCFDRGIAACTGDIVFFLDADDEWEPDHVAGVLEVFEQRPDIGFVFTAFRLIGDRSGTEHYLDRDHDFGLSVMVSALGRASLGTITSCLAIRRDVLSRLFPVAPELFRDWRICADEYLIIGSSLAGARKYYLNSPSTRYRHHGANLWAGIRKPDIFLRRSKQIATIRMINYLRKRLHLETLPSHELSREFRTIPRPSPYDLRHARRVLRRARLPATTRLRNLIDVYHHYLSTRMSSRRDESVKETADAEVAHACEKMVARPRRQAAV